MKGYLIGILTLGCCFGSSVSFAQDEPIFQKIGAVAGVSADVQISYPSIGVNSADRAIRNYISREIKIFKQQLKLNLGAVGSEQNVFHIDCKIVTNTKVYYSVLCDQYVYVQGARGVSVQTFNYNKHSHTVIGLSSLFPDYKLSFLSQNLRRYFINKLQATTTEAQDWIKDGITARYADYDKFTIGSNGSGIQSLHVYFNPFTIGGAEQGIQFVKLSYPGLKIMR